MPSRTPRKAAPPSPPSLDSLFEAVSERVTPTRAEAEAEKKFAFTLVEKLESALAGKKVRVYLVGSTARDTGLRGDRDIDLFACFPTTNTREEIVEQTFSAVRSQIPGHWETHYAEHPYLQAKLGDYRVEVIPCFIALPHTPIKSAVDRSPLHMDYLQKRLSPEQKRDVRVLKQLLKRAGIYGAESRVGGFSGLLCEYLILNYRSLEGVLAAARDWKPPVVIDIEGMRIQEAGSAKKVAETFEAPLVLIDAIDKNRNAAAAVAAPALAAFVSLAHSFLQTPSLRFFFDESPVARKPMPSSQLMNAMKARGTAFVLLEFPLPADVVEDILNPQMRKTLHSLSGRLTEEEFTVVDSLDFATGRMGYYLFELAHDLRPAVKRIVGPPPWFPKDADAFVASHPTDTLLRGPFLFGDRLAVEVSRKETRAEEVLTDLLVHERTVSVGSHLSRGLRRARMLSGGAKIISTLVSEKKDEPLRVLEGYLFRKLPWLL